MNCRILPLCFALGAVAFGGHALTTTTDDVNGDDKPDTWFEHERGRLVSFRADRNFDGHVDHLTRYDAAGIKQYEEFDFDYDQVMDDFYYFVEGELVRQEIDTNFDGVVDTWVYLDAGLYISRYERDLDHDGTVDQIRDFAASGGAGTPVASGSGSTAN